jgi:hypothetical protein
MNVTRLGAVLEVEPHGPLSSGFAIREFADLDDGRRVWWREDRGWSSSSPHISSGRDLVAEVLEVTGGHERVDDYVICALWALNDIEPGIDAASLWAAPYVVEFGPELVAKLERASVGFTPPPPPTVPDLPTAHTGDRAVAMPPDS